ncbi:uncharacterized protein [Typha latifolia]|uniref:uncharacterized protein n=1 Tax=Typha latifolia TaxID=4733 RepID=UPI003C2EC883
MKSEVSSITMTYRSTISTTKNSKVNHNVTTGSGTSNTVSGEQSLDVKGFSSNLKKLSSAKSSEHSLCKRVEKQVGSNVTPIALSSVQVQERINSVVTAKHDLCKRVDKQVGSNVTPIALSSVQVQDRINSAVSAKALSSYALNGHDVSGGPPASHVKPSALRMPSPSLGFFCQGKVTSSFDTDSRRNMEKSLSNVPPRKPISLKQTNDSKPVHVSAEGKPVAVKRCATSILSGSSKSSLIASSLPSSGLAVDIHSFVGKSSVLQLCRASGNSSCVSSSPEPSKFACLLVDNSINSPGLEKHDVGRVKVLYEDNNTLQVDSRIPVEENTSIAQPLKQKPSKRPDGNKFPSENVSLDICIPEVRCERQSKSIFEGDSGENNFTKNLPVGDARGESSVSLSEGRQSAENSNSVPAIGSQCTFRDIELASSLELYSSFKLNKEQTAVVGTVGNERSDCLLGKNVVMPAERADLSSTSLEDKNYRLQFDKNNPISLKNDEAFIPIKNETVNKFRAESLPLKHQQNLIPFSDEWLAAREAFGKEILELKTGPVQHSPTEKSIPEPSPWSPVKRKHQEVGPFDCTKYSKDPSTLDTQ